jgi:hypothetical protein
MYTVELNEKAITPSEASIVSLTLFWTIGSDKFPVDGKEM